jgi:2-keto-4-pentenoate hydratase/2-oxohepta-3-ene-1,7-dioic acid hydratase in catechol pathway
MKIICIGRNYADHAIELKNELPEFPLFFLKPDTSLLIKTKDFYIPDFTNDLHYECEIVVRINRVGKNIQEKFASNYYDEIGLGIDFTARDIQEECKQKGLPWERAKAFDFSSPIGDFFIPKEELDPNNIRFRLFKNDKQVQFGETKNMIFSIDQIISYVSQFITLKVGDLIYTGTPSGVGPVSIGDKIVGYLEDKKIIDLNIK